MSRLVRYFSLFIFLAVSGCGTSEPTAARAMIEGSIHWNGEPVADGIVTFIPSAPPQGVEFKSIPALVSDGKYKIAEADGATAGSFRVEVRAFRKTGKRSPEPTAAMKRFDPTLKSEELKDQVIPPQFNEQSTLTREVAIGPNRFDFDLHGREIRSSR